MLPHSPALHESQGYHGQLLFAFSRCLLARGNGWGRIGSHWSGASCLQKFRRYVENDADGLAAAAIELLNIGGLQDFEIGLANRRIELFAALWIVQPHLSEHNDAGQHFFELVDGSLGKGFSFDDHAKEISFGLSTDRDPLQLAEQGGELGRSEAAGGMLREIAQGLGVFVKNGEDRSAGEAEKMLAPVRGRKSGAGLREVSGIIGPGDAVVAEERVERGARRAGNRNSVEGFSAGAFKRAEFCAIGFDFFSFETAVGDCDDSGSGSLAGDGNGKPVEIALVIESGRLNELRVVPFGRRVWRPREEL
jgi:hypothetical protein